MAKSKIIQKMIRYEGTTQNERTSMALDPSTFELMEYDVQKWMEFAFDFASEINFFSTNNHKNPSGNWQNFFAKKEAIEQLLSDQHIDGNTQPQLALFICFLNLLEESRSRFNLLTKRHLDFYYKEVLKLDQQAAVADQAHVLFELAKKANQVLIPKGSLLDGGKDENNTPIVFETKEDLVTNQIQVSALKNVYVNKNHQLFSAENATMADGLETELEDATLGWYPFGSDEKWNGIDYLASPNIGFYIASSILDLSEGVRTIGLNFNTANKALSTHFSAEITGAEGWMPLVNANDDVFENDTTFESQHQICFQLPAFEKATAAYDKEIHGGNYDTNLPVIRFFYLHHTNKLKTLSEFKIQNIELQVDVKGIKELQSQNNQGLLNVKKAFIPFGALPKKGADWYVNHTELNDRLINSGTLYINRVEDSSFDILLSQNTVKTQKSALQKIIKTQPILGGFLSRFYFKNFIAKAFPESGESQLHFGQKHITERGLKIELNSEHNSIAKVNVKSTGTEANKTYTIDQTQGNEIPPTVDTIELDYTATAVDVSFGHLHPFGNQLLENEKDKTLLPPEYVEQSFFYIGFEQAQNLDVVSLLFQVEEGSENPLKTPPKLSWDILTDAGWSTNKDEEFLLLEDTNHFIKTGLVQLKISKSATTEHTLMPLGLHWIRVAMADDFDTLCKLVSVKAQAVLAERVLNTSTENFTHLPPESIGKMIQRLAQTKSVIQPFASFNGKSKETDEAYYVRASERLRHKNRAVTAWDCEHLLLQEFPTIYKVKTLNHSTFVDGVLYTKAPGNITLVVVPDLTKRSVFDVYEPRFPASELLEMQNFLAQRVGGQVGVSVINPQFRKVKVTATVKFHKGKDENFYKKETEKDITKFLSPWAFDIHQDIVFNTAVHSSSLLFYLENLEYIDYIDHLKIEQEKQINNRMVFEMIKQEATALKPHQILVSNKIHSIKIAEKTCDKKV